MMLDYYHNKIFLLCSHVEFHRDYILIPKSTDVFKSCRLLKSVICCSLIVRKYFSFIHDLILFQ